MEIVTKYQIGDTVFQATTAKVKGRLPCPDCKGERKWSTTSPAGESYAFACPRCSASYISDHDLSLDYYEATPNVIALTIGSIRYNSHEGFASEARPEVSYMCIETGVGSGQTYRETNLFADRETALIAAELVAAKENEKAKARGGFYAGNLSLSDYQLKFAVDEGAKQRLSDAKDKLERLSNSVSEAFTERLPLGELKEAIEEAFSKSGYDLTLEKA